jgi:hypothetical protein
MPTQKLTHEILIAAIEGFDAQKTRINAKIAELRQMLNGGPTVTSAPAPRKRRKMSASARKRIGEAQRKRWAEYKKKSEATQPATARKTARKRVVRKAAVKTTAKAA